MLALDNLYKAAITPSIPKPATAAPKASGRAPAALVPVAVGLELVILAESVAGEALDVIVEASVVVCPFELVVVMCVTCEAQLEALLAASEPMDCASEPMELPAVSAAEAMEAASPVSDATAAEPPVCTAFAMEVASARASDPIDSPPVSAVEAAPAAAEMIESTFTPSGAAMAPVERRRAVVRRVNFIMAVWLKLVFLR